MSNSSRAILLWIVVSLLMVLHFFMILSVGVLTSALHNDLRLTALELSFLSSSYLYIYLLMQTPAGILLDNFGSRKLLTIGALVSAMGCWSFAQSDNLFMAIVSRVLMGGGLTFVFISSVQLASRWFPKRYFSMMIGFSEASGMFGAIVGNMLLAIYLNKIGWRHSFALASVVALALSFMSFIFIRDYPNRDAVPVRSRLTIAKVLVSLRILTRMSLIWLHSIYISLMYVSVTVFSGLWANPFLRRAYNLNLEQSTLSCCLVLAGIGIGSPIVGALCDTNKSRNICIQASALFMLVLMCCLLYIQNLSFGVINFLMFSLGLSGSGIILSFAIVSDIAPEGAKSTSVGLTNTISLITAVVFQPVIGWLLNILSSELNTKGLEYYTANHYRIALSVLPILLLIAFGVGSLIARKSKHIHIHHATA